MKTQRAVWHIEGACRREVEGGKGLREGLKKDYKGPAMRGPIVGA